MALKRYSRILSISTYCYDKWQSVQMCANDEIVRYAKNSYEAYFQNSALESNSYIYLYIRNKMFKLLRCFMIAFGFMKNHKTKDACNVIDTYHK